MALELEHSITNVAWEADVGTGDGEIRVTDDSNDSAGDADADAEDEVAVVRDKKEDCDGFGAKSEDAVFVVAEEEDDEDKGPGEVVVGEAAFSIGGDGFRGSLLGVAVLGAATGTAEIVRVVLALSLTMGVGEGVETILEATISGLESGALPDLLRMRCRSDDECPSAAARSLEDLVVRMGCCGCGGACCCCCC